jgi:hypothetical protein
MRKLIIQSHSESEDIKAAALITQEMVNGDAGQIIWYSRFGEKISELEKIVTDNAREINEVLARQQSSFKTLSDFQTNFINLKIELDETKKKLTDLVKSAKEEKKKKEEKTAKKAEKPTTEKT